VRTSPPASGDDQHLLPILVSHLFPELLEGLLALLARLATEDWKRP